MFDWSTLVPQDAGVFSSDQLREEKAELVRQLKQVRDNLRILDPLRSFAKERKLPDLYFDDPFALGSVRVEDLADHGFIQESATEVVGVIDRLITEANGNIRNNFDPASWSNLESVSKIVKRPIATLRDEDISKLSIGSWGQVNLFQQSFSRLFVSYRDLSLANLISRIDAADRGIPDYSLSTSAFEDAFGPPPWEFVNSVLRDSGLDFIIDAPALNDYVPYQPQLTKRESGAQISFSSLSSGEKIIMSFAFCMYYSSDKRQITTYPKLILFDEIDAPLHPAMTRGLLTTISDTLVRDFSIKVILTTHSPSTVALAPENSIYLMTSGGEGLSSISKEKALDVLLIGVPRLALTFSGRRQILVESPADARTYEALYRICRSYLDSERSLEFIATGAKASDGTERNTGCAVVKRLVLDLRSAGNSSIFGLVDWDGENDPDEFISVLAHRVRDGLENIVFDPLAVAALICRQFPNQQSRIGLQEGTRFLQFAQYTSDELQPLVDAVCDEVLGASSDERMYVSYLGGFQLCVSKEYLTMDDHELEGRLLRAFPFFNAISKGGKLVSSYRA